MLNKGARSFTQVALLLRILAARDKDSFPFNHLFRHPEKANRLTKSVYLDIILIRTCWVFPHRAGKCASRFLPKSVQRFLRVGAVDRREYYEPV